MKTLLGLMLVLAGSSAFACKIGMPPAYDPSAGTSEQAPSTALSSVKASLGRNFGGPGPGDCSQLGTLEIELTPADGSTLDGRFGAKLIVTKGELPVALVDLTTWVAPIQNNKVTVTLSGSKPSVDFTLSVQLVNATGPVGEPTAAVRETRSAGCSVTGAFPIALLALGAFARRRPRLV